MIGIAGLRYRPHRPLMTIESQKQELMSIRSVREKPELERSS